ncbi:NEAT domain-containing protein [Loigolactobacillus coryniformis]|uniref:NEAT domain-containing protein n=1 Tax=Loigolactobacillus coryniformis TaxID=1610 RepID=UPI00201AD4FC|nr:NEAT domain-containing protein [Loigolactobacillus coryniformis]MCL5457999.1 NEAT domain-containing protein [Loigolactobacillus coryniformis]
MKKHLLTYLSVSVLLLGAVAPSVSALAVTPVSAAEQTSATALDPNNLADGTYTIDAPVMKAGTNDPSTAQEYISKFATLVVKNQQLTLTLHVISDASIGEVRLSSNQQAAKVSDSGTTKDMTFNVSTLTAALSLDLDLNTPLGSIHETMDVKPDVATLKVVQLDQPATASSTTTVSKGVTSESSQATQSSVTSGATQASTASHSTADPATTTSSSRPVAAVSSRSAVPNESSVANQESASQPASTTVKQSNQSESKSATTEPTTQSTSNTATTTTFDPAHLVDGSYEVPMTVLKEKTDEASISAKFFAPTATVKVAGKQVTVTLHLTQNASTVTVFSLAGQAAKISNNDDTKADLTFNVDKNFDTAIIPATMTISVPAMGMVMNEKARVKFGQALYSATDPTTAPTKSATTTLQDGIYEAPIAILKADSSTELSMANAFFKPTAVVRIVDGKATVSLYLQKNANTVADFSLDGTAADFSNKTTDTATMSFTNIANYADTTVPATMTIQPMPSFSMKQQAQVKFGQLTAVKAGATTESSASASSESKASSASESKASNKVNSSSAKASSTTESSSSQPNTTDTTTETTDASKLPAFDPNKLTDGVYQTDVTILKDDGVTPSHSAGFFAKKAIITVANKKAKVTLHITQNASLVAAFALADQNATISNKTKDSVDLTFAINDKFANALVTATMSIAVPGMGKSMTETAKVKFGQALYVAPTITEQPSNNTDTGTTTTKPTQTTTVFDPAHLVDGTYEVPMAVLKEKTDEASVSASFFAPTATVKVAGKQVTVTLHLTKNASTVTAFSVANQDAKITNNDGTKADLTFTVDKNFDTTIMPAAVRISVPAMGMVMNEKARVKFGQALFAANSTDTESNTSSESAAKAASESKAKAESAAKAASESKAKAESAAKAASESKAKAESAAKAASESKTKAASESVTKNDSSKLKDGTYEALITVLKAESSTELSTANAFFKPTATIRVVNGKTSVILYLQKNAATVAKFSLNNTVAEFSERTTNTATMTFANAANYANTTVPATMTIQPMPNFSMKQQAQKAQIKFGKLTAVKATDDANKASSNESEKTKAESESKAREKSESASNRSTFDLKNPQDGTYEIPFTLLKEKVNTKSIASAFFKPTATVKVANEKTTVTLHLIANASFVSNFILGGQEATVSNETPNSKDLTFTVDANFKADIVSASMYITATDEWEKARVKFGQALYAGPGKPDTQVGNEETGGATEQPFTGTNLINPTKTVQYIPYKVLDETRSKLSTANNYYTHTAKVVKDSSGYKVYLTVQAPTGYVKFQPLSVNYGGYSDFSHSTAGGNDIWTYAFHISNEQGLDQPIPATISMTVPIAGISNQQFEVWLSFGKAQGGGTNYLAAANAATTQGLPATTISLVQAANGNTILPAAGTSLTAISATQPTKAVKATKPAKTAANKTKKVAAATTITAAEQQKSAKLKVYPFMAEIAGFGAVALVIIGFAVYKRLHVGE